MIRSIVNLARDPMTSFVQVKYTYIKVYAFTCTCICKACKLLLLYFCIRVINWVCF